MWVAPLRFRALSAQLNSLHAFDPIEFGHEFRGPCGGEQPNPERKFHRGSVPDSIDRLRLDL